jgi:hypothetical protein
MIADDTNYTARSKQAQIMDLHAGEINKIQKTSATIRNGLSSRVSDIITQSNEQTDRVLGWVCRGMVINAETWVMG